MYQYQRQLQLPVPEPVIQDAEFELLTMRDVFSEQKIALEMEAYLKLSPERHQTDGFFAAAFQRKK